MEKIIIYIDGGSRGNPGPSAIGVVLKKENGQILKKYSEYIGKATNNDAEYQAAIFALKKTKLLFGKKALKSLEIDVFSDSELLVSQLEGRYKIINSKIGEYFLKIWNLKIDFGSVSFKLVPREKNKEADQLVNEALDEHNKSQNLF